MYSGHAPLHEGCSQKKTHKNHTVNVLWSACAARNALAYKAWWKHVWRGAMATWRKSPYWVLHGGNEHSLTHKTKCVCSSCFWGHEAQSVGNIPTFLSQRSRLLRAMCFSRKQEDSVWISFLPWSSETGWRGFLTRWIVSPASAIEFVLAMHAILN